MLNDISIFADSWVIVRRDGTPVLNGTPEQFEQSLRELVERLTSEKQSVEYNNE